MAVVTADIVESKLRQWKTGQVSAAEVHDWAEKTFAVDSWEPESDAVNEVLAELDMLDMNLVIPDDIPVLVTALRAKNFEALLSEYFSKIDFELRKSQLSADPLYAPFCAPKT